jgi:hypothetical protein
MQNEVDTPRQVTVPPSGPRLDLNAVLGCEYGNYPWDHWHRWAIAEGLDSDPAGAGRLLIRKAYQHGWDPWLQSLCGWGDDGQALLALALRSPRTARRRWDILMRTDGLRGDYSPRSVEWVWGYLRADAQRLMVALGSQPSAR